jgi:hypothetical protein
MGNIFALARVGTGAGFGADSYLRRLQAVKIVRGLIPFGTDFSLQTAE